MIPLSELNAPQREAVTTANGPLLLLAGAGSGKTRVITARIAHMVKTLGVHPSQILAVTFTNKAAEEMKERVREQLGGGPAPKNVSTFHSLGVRVLRRHIHLLDYQGNFTIYDSQDQLSLVKSLFEESDAGLAEAASIPDAKTLHFMIGQAKGEGKTPEEYLQMRGNPAMVAFGTFFKEYQTLLKGCNAVDFEDILTFTLRLLREFPDEMAEWISGFRYVMVDEYQDTNRTQYELIKRVAAPHRNLCVVGDDDQSIYGWRGADVRNILDFERDFPEAKVIRLEQNYRSTQTILDAANQVIANNPERMDKKLWSAKGHGQPLGWLVGEDEAEEMEKVADRIRAGRTLRKREWRDYAVLYRSNFQSRAVEEALRDADIPYRLVGQVSFYERREVKDAIAYLRLIHNTRDEVSLHRVVNYPKRGIGRASLVKAVEVAKALNRPLFNVMEGATAHGSIPVEAAYGMEMFCDMVRRYRARFESAPIDEAYGELEAEVGLARELEKEKADAKTRDKRVAYLHEFHRGMSLYRQKYPERGLKDFLERLALFARDDDGGEQPDVVTLMTLHSAKGLEFPYVYLVGMADGVFPNKKALEGGGEEEERRLCYVGITRAMRELTFTMPKQRKRYGESELLTPSRFLREISPDLFADVVFGKADPQQKAKAAAAARSDFFSQIKSLRKED